jgi:hypothetical protein
VRQFFRTLLGKLDVAVSEFFWLQSWGDTSNPERERWTFYVDRGHTIGIVGTDGKVHTMVGYHAVNHYYEGGRLARRVPVRRDLKPGERRATAQEIDDHRRELSEHFSHAHGFIMS